MENELSNLDKLSEALANAQAEIKAPLKNRTVDFTDKNGRRVNYSYADLNDVIESLKPMHKHGLSITHRMVQNEFHLCMVTTLHHSSGQKLETFYPLPDPTSMRPQEFGSALTYGRRYSVSMITGIASEEDDDGAEAAPATKKTSPPPKPKLAPNPADPILVQLTRLVNDKGIVAQMPDIIKRVTGEEKKSTELTDAQVLEVFKFLKMKYP